jgi:hypothetical protein
MHCLQPLGYWITINQQEIWKYLNDANRYGIMIAEFIEQPIIGLIVGIVMMEGYNFAHVDDFVSFFVVICADFNDIN